jgi:hypothetical protein
MPRRRRRSPRVNSPRPAGIPRRVTETQTTAERVARNDAIFREANEGIESAAREYSIDGSLPFICECAEPTCQDIVRLDLAAYDAIRAVPTHFLNAPGHVKAAQGWATIVESRDGYDVVEKVGPAADLAEELDPRSE